MPRSRSNSTAGFLLTSLQKSARRLSLARFTSRAEFIDLENQPLEPDTELARINNQYQLTLEKQKKRECRKKLHSRYNREMDSEYIPYDEMGTAAIFVLIIFVVFILYVAEREISHLKFINLQKDLMNNMHN